MNNTATTSATLVQEFKNLQTPSTISDFFTQIHHEPSTGIPESALNKLYYAKIDDEPVYMKLIDTTRLPFEAITNEMTVKATGMLYFDWRQQWMEKYPDTRPHTKMCIYHFKKQK